MISAFVMMLFNVLYDKTHCAKWEELGLGLVPFTLAVMAIPVFDTLRVMSVRMLKNKSPFKPDKTHLHHLFIDMKFSHIGTTVAILTLNSLIVALWFLAWKLGASIDIQFYIVVFLSVLVTFGLYSFMRRHEKKKTRFFIKCCSIGRRTHIARTGFWKFMMNVMDKGGLYNKD